MNALAMAPRFRSNDIDRRLMSLISLLLVYLCAVSLTGLTCEGPDIAVILAGLLMHALFVTARAIVRLMGP